MPADAITIDLSDYDLPQDEIQVFVEDIFESFLGEGDIDGGPLDVHSDGDYLLAQAIEAVHRSERPAEDYVREIADEFGVLEFVTGESNTDGGLAFERDMAVREARLAEAGLKVIRMALNDNRPLEALFTANNELERLDEELEAIEEIGETREADDGDE